MFKQNPKAKYKPNGRYLKIMLGKNLYNQMIVVSVKENDTFNSNDACSASFRNVFVNYSLLSKCLCQLFFRWNANHRYEMEVLKCCTFEAMANPVELCDVLHIKRLQG